MRFGGSTPRPPPPLPRSAGEYAASGRRPEGSATSAVLGVLPSSRSTWMQLQSMLEQHCW